ncbi:MULTISPECIES: FAD-dependent oxidoreductase [unclassified Halanaerobium]|uniref:FAD-dependent oxidoreductase n=1 Tax=unclassified Halanaerobium TaxID=2641197 RepID=UPI000DF1FDD2|nr:MULTISPECIES: FAD-dependent oxidoreductase [unclassified Halanaerobium]RCW50427.1 alkyl hydroperoxide reductase subunit F [Halanaerobium sp. MA284_MarDTE_T2]RCW84228.1 alkyl hydroperoxide reductase subunit F [Halanaerobium sp. DL-01]
MTDKLKIEVYSKGWCPYCKKAKAFLKSKNLDYIEYNIDNEEKFEEMKTRTGRKTVPQIIINGQCLGGYDDLIKLEKSGDLDNILGVKSEDYSQKKWDLIIIGAGPAGLNAVLYAARKGIDLLLISKDIGGQVIDTNEIDNYLGKAQINGDDLIMDFWDHIHNYDITAVIGEEILKIESQNGEHILRTDSEKEYIARSVIIASGAEKRHLGMKQEYVLKGKGVHYCISCDGYLYAGKRAAVVGGGNSGLEAALDLAKMDAEVILVEIMDYLMGDEVLREKVASSDKIDVYTSTSVKEIIGEDSLEAVILENKNTGEEKRIELDGLFIEIGLSAKSDFVPDIMERNKQKEIIINDKNETNIEGLFAAGDVSNIIDKQIVISAAEGAKAALRVNQYLS